MVAVISANCKYIVNSLQKEIANLGKDALFCEAEKHYVGESIESHIKPSTNVWSGQLMKKERLRKGRLWKVV